MTYPKLPGLTRDGTLYQNDEMGTVEALLPTGGYPTAHAPAMVELEPGHLVAFMRNREAYRIHRSESFDWGESWGEPKPTPLPNNNSSISAIKLRSGRVAIAYNPTCTPDPHPGKAAWPGLRCPVAVALSEDGGLTFPIIRWMERGEGYMGDENRTNNKQYEYPYLILNNIEAACDDPEAMTEKNRMQIAAYYGGLAITASGTTAVHALSYPLGGKYHIAHGVSNAILLAPVMRFNSEHPAVRQRLAIAYDRCCHEEKTCATVDEKAAWIIARLEQIVRHLDIPTSLKEFGVPAEDLEGLVKAGMEVQRLLVNNMRPVTPDDARRLYQEVM